MTRCKSLSILCVTAGSLCAIALIYAGTLQDEVFGTPPGHVPIQRCQGTREHHPSPLRYGKIEMPVNLSIDLAQADNPGLPVTIITTVSTDMPVRSGLLTLKIPQIEADPERTDPLWSGVHAGIVAETAEYTLGFLPVGRYQIIALFEFTMDREGAKKRILSRSLYVDVRPDVILSSNVSFRHIDRLELRRDLDERIVTSPEQGLKSTDRRRVLRELTLLEAGDPAMRRKKIRELRASDPDVARRMMALNRAKSEPMDETSPANAHQTLVPESQGDALRPRLLPHRGQPAFEQAVPVPERLKR